MTSKEKTISTRRAAANQVNGRASRGPITKRGKARASQNARRYGLTLSVIGDPVFSKDAEMLAREIANGVTEPDVLECAGAVAEAQIDLKRIRQARLHILTVNGNDHYDETSSEPRQSVCEIEPVSSAMVKQLLVLDRYARRAFSRRKYVIRRLRVALELFSGGYKGSTVKLELMGPVSDDQA